jgi:cyclic pyranopterin phosphate synthase
MTNLHCESCNKSVSRATENCVRARKTEFDIMTPLRAGASDQSYNSLDVVDRKPEQHDFRQNYQPNRKMIAIGG